MQVLRLPPQINSKYTYQAGFTFLELIITIAVGAILLAVAVPSFQSLLTNNRLTATTNTLVYSLQTARSEAIKRATPAGVCTSNSPLDPDATCSAGSGYVGGWIAYVDENSNGSRDAGEEIVMAVEDRGGAFSITTPTQFENQVYFDESGSSTNTVGVPLSGEFNVAYGQGSEQRTVRVLATGRISTVTP